MYLFSKRQCFRCVHQLINKNIIYSLIQNHFQIFFFLISTICVQILLFYQVDSLTNTNSTSLITGDNVIYWKRDTGVPYKYYAQIAMRVLATKQKLSYAVSCENADFRVQKVAKLPIRETPLFSTLGDTLMHGIKAVLDKRSVYISRIYGVVRNSKKILPKKSSKNWKIC